MKKLLLAVLATCILAVPGTHAAQKKAAPAAPPATAAPAKPAKSPAPSAAPAARPDLSQGDFVTKLFETFHWGAGLPDEPKDQDYQTILAGRRTFVYEAELLYDADRDGVSLKNFPLYGPFTGVGWVSGVATATKVHFKFLLPIEGNYQLIVHGKGDGQKWEMGSQKFTVSAGDRLNSVPAGSTGYLEAGFHEITVDLPPEGAIDSFTLTAPVVAAVQPAGGWRSKDALTAGDMAQAGAALLGLEPTLPVDRDTPPVRVAAADVVASQPRVELTTRDFFGKFYSPKWVRAGFEGAGFTMPFNVAVQGVYTLRLRYLGEGLKGNIDDQPIAVATKPSFDWVDLGTLRLEKGRHLLTLQLPPTAGVDLLELQRLHSSPADYLKLMGMSGTPSDKVTADAAETFIASLKERFKERR